MSKLAEIQARTNQQLAVSVVFVAAMFISIMDTSIVNVALPAIARGFHERPTDVAGVSIAFLVSLAVFIPASGWLGDRYGGKRVLLASIAVFTVASTLCGLATSKDELELFRVLQGVGGGMLAPVGTAMLFRVFPPQERVRAASILIVPTAIAPAIAPILGGLLVTYASWRWVFFVNLPIGLASLVYGVLFVRHQAESEPGRFDAPGFVLSAAGLGLAMYGVSEGPTVGWGSTRVLATVTTGLVLLLVMLIVELRARQPIIALRMFGNGLLRAGTASALAVSTAFFGVLFTITLYYQQARGMSAVEAGLSQFPTAIGIIVGSQVGTRLVYWRLGPRRHLTIGLVGAGVSMSSLALLGMESSLWLARLILFVVGLSMAQVMVPSQTASFATVSPADTGRASTLYNASRQLGAASGVAALTTAITLVGPLRQVDGHPIAHLAAYHVAFLVAAAIALLGVPSALKIQDAEAAPTMVDPRRPKPTVMSPPASGSRGRTRDGGGSDETAVRGQLLPRRCGAPAQWR